MNLSRLIPLLLPLMPAIAWPEAGQAPVNQDTLLLPEKEARARKAVTPSNSQVIRDRDLALRPMLDPADILKVTPGLFVGQHAGGGKANQYFLRGFDIDHGTDLSLWFDGMPINMISHGHGQGYADLHFIIPELVEKVEVNKGPYYVEYGDLATAGAVRMDARRRFGESRVSLSGGMFQTFRSLSILTLDHAPLRPVLAAEISRSDGPFKSPEDMERYNLYLKAPLLENETTTLDATLMGYGAGWNGSGQVPARLVDAGLLDRFGSVDPTEGGHSQRHSASMEFNSNPNPVEEWKASAYVIDYRLSLYSDFTFFARDSVNGDGINQRDDRVISGFNASYKRDYSLGGLALSSLFGLGARNDRIHNNLDYSRKRTVFDHVTDADVREGSLSAYFMESIAPFEWLYAEAGVRGDHFGFDVADRLRPEGDSTLTGVRDASIFSPKVNVVVTPFANTDLYANYGEGFHSNDARGVTSKTNPARPLTKARGYEAGARTRLFDRVDLGFSLWKLDMDGEFVWVGDDGSTEEGLPSERLGMDVEARAEILPWLWADFDMTRSSSEYTQNAGNGKAVALAPRLTWAGGISALHPAGFSGSLRGQSLDDRPADEAGNFVAQGFTVFDLSAGYRYEWCELRVNIQNLFDTEWRSAQFENDSRLAGGSPFPYEAEPVTDIHFVPGTPINVQASLNFYF
jgi:outer membrane receptor protein involved in Fe transport